MSSASKLAGQAGNEGQSSSPRKKKSRQDPSSAYGTNEPMTKQANADMENPNENSQQVPLKDPRAETDLTNKWWW